MDQVTQQNAALVEEAAAAAVSMQEQAASLNTSVGTFRLEVDSRVHRAAVARLPAPSSGDVARLSNAKSVAKPASRVAAAPQVKKALAATGTDGGWSEF
jgi:hypothetical protein